MHVTFRPSQPPLQLWAQQLRVMQQPAPRPLLAPRGGRGPLKWTPSETTRCKRRSWQHHRSEYQEWTTKRRLNQWEGQRSWILTRSVGGNLNRYLVSTPKNNLIKIFHMITHTPWLSKVAFEGRGGQSAWEPASGRFLSFYWYTSTTTSTKTTYTKTTTFTITACTPAGSFSYSACG